MMYMILFIKIEEHKDQDCDSQDVLIYVTNILFYIIMYGA